MRPTLLPLLLAASALLGGACHGPADPAVREQVAAEPGAPSASAASADTPSPADVPSSADTPSDAMTDTPERTEIATLGAGCFWCIEAVLEQVDGVLDVTSGYMGGHVTNPTYRQVCNGDTGHAEVVQVRFDPETLPYEHLLAWFWRLHDPTTLNRQGNDVGPQYRSAIFTHSEAQRAAAETAKAEADASGDFPRPIVTEITEASTFWPAEDDHQEYYRLNRAEPYCRMVIAPKLEKLNLEK